MTYGRWCCEEVSRGGLLVPCDKPAVALRRDPEESGKCYEVCGYHARGDMVGIEDLVVLLSC